MPVPVSVKFPTSATPIRLLLPLTLVVVVNDRSGVFALVLPATIVLLSERFPLVLFRKIPPPAVTALLPRLHCVSFQPMLFLRP